MAVVELGLEFYKMLRMGLLDHEQDSNKWYSPSDGHFFTQLS